MKMNYNKQLLQSYIVVASKSNMIIQNKYFWSDIEKVFLTESFFSDINNARDIAAVCFMLRKLDQRGVNLSSTTSKLIEVFK